MIEISPIEPTPSDFGQFVYCGLQWFYKKDRRLDGAVAAKKASYDISSEANYRMIGKQNEHKCIDRVIKDNRLSSNDIVYVGTNDSHLKSLTFDVLGKQMSCKPDLIIKIRGQIILYEFKTVGDPKHLGSQFDNNLAQIWCYTKILDYQVDKFYLFQYYIDPFYTGLPWGRLPYRVTEQFTENRSEFDPAFMELSPEHRLDPDYFDEKFTKYLNTIEYITIKNTKLIHSLIENSPKNDGMKRQKCYGCLYRTISCPIGQALQ